MIPDAFAFYRAHVQPHVPPVLPDGVRIGPADGYTPLTNQRVCMVVGLTGTGKSTALGRLPHPTDRIPSRRALADLVVIPTAQVHRGATVRPVTDRTERFEHTRYFAQHIHPGGAAAVFAWLHIAGNADEVVLSEGVRGPHEIRYVLTNCPNWRVFELWIDPVLRLKRLSTRGDHFDTEATGAVDLAFLGEAQAVQVRAMLETREILPRAVITARAEARNYGAAPYDPSNNTPNYHCLVMDDLSPDDVARQLTEWIRQ